MITIQSGINKKNSKNPAFRIFRVFYKVLNLPDRKTNAAGNEIYKLKESSIRLGRHQVLFLSERDPDADQ